MLAPDHVRRVLEQSPEPFAVANLEKRSAVRRFQPNGLLVSHGAARADRRRFNEAVLDTDRPVHHLADDLVTKLREELTAVAGLAGRGGRLYWEDFARGWWRMVRRVVLGDAARDDHVVTALLARLRAGANWGYARPGQHRLSRRFERRLRTHVDRAEPGSLAQLVATTRATAQTVPHDQVPQWLFAFDAAAMAGFRALALLATHPHQAGRVRDELADRDLTAPQDLPYLRACVLESLRLWPTTPGVLRETTAATRWETGVLPAGTAVLIYAPLFHRDPDLLDDADRFRPELWSAGYPTPRWPLIPFSAGPAECAGRNLVLLLTSMALATLLDRGSYRLLPPHPLGAGHALPGTLSPFRLRFAVGS